MFRVTSLANMPEQQLNRWIKRLALLFVVVLIAFVGFYAVDRFRMPSAPIVDREMAAMEEAVRSDPTDVASRGRLADLYLAADRYDEAIAQYAEIIKSGKQDEAGYASRGKAYELKGDAAAAAADYQKVVDIAKDSEMANVDPMLEMAYYGLGVMALRDDRADEAIDYLLKALTIKRTDADAMNMLGAAYVKADQPDKAVQPLRKAIEFVPVGWAEPYVTLSAAYAATGDTALAEWAGAMAVFGNGDAATAETRLRALTDGPAAVDANVGIGLLLEMRGDMAQAADAYRAAIAIDPQNESAALGIGRVSPPSAQPSAAATPAASPSEGSN
jgi:tetratricopeptide (TPR) repeat protein